mmetsp:Transcript_29176/g.78740  ORF Transcript_29176/g.78740 Transcript_29176/m.78740 type:complete len:478 (+) Transcript_29176:211-1644(+)
MSPAAVALLPELLHDPPQRTALEALEGIFSLAESAPLYLRARRRPRGGLRKRNRSAGAGSARAGRRRCSRLVLAGLRIDVHPVQGPHLPRVAALVLVAQRLRRLREALEVLLREHVVLVPLQVVTPPHVLLLRAHVGVDELPADPRRAVVVDARARPGSCLGFVLSPGTVAGLLLLGQLLGLARAGRLPLQRLLGAHRLAIDHQLLYDPLVPLSQGVVGLLLRLSESLLPLLAGLPRRLLGLLGQLSSSLACLLPLFGLIHRLRPGLQHPLPAPLLGLLGSLRLPLYPHLQLNLLLLLGLLGRLFVPLALLLELPLQIFALVLLLFHPALVVHLVIHRPRLRPLLPLDPLCSGLLLLGLPLLSLVPDQLLDLQPFLPNHLVEEVLRLGGLLGLLVDLLIVPPGLLRLRLQLLLLALFAHLHEALCQVAGMPLEQGLLGEVQLAPVEDAVEGLLHVHLLHAQHLVAPVGVAAHEHRHG